MAVFDKISWTLVLMTLLLGLAPFTPEPHVWQKLKMLWAGELRQAIDIFDLLMHATPWVLLVLKSWREVTKPSDA